VTISIDKVKALSESDRSALKSKDIDCAEQLWSAMADDPGLIGNLGLPDIDAQKRVTKTLASLAKTESNHNKQLVCESYS